MSRETMEFWKEWSAQVLLEGSVLPIIATVQGSKEGGVKTGSTCGEREQRRQV